MIGLPGNPVSAMVCGVVFVAPVVRKMLGLPAQPAPRLSLPLAVDLPQGGPRAHYMRALVTGGAVHPENNQDSSLLSVLAQADVLMIRPAGDPARQSGDMMDCIAL